MLFMKEFNLGCHIFGVIPVSLRFVVFPDAQSHRPILSQASIQINSSQHFLRLHILHIEMLRKQCIYAENASSISTKCKFVFLFLWLFFGYVSVHV